MKIRKFKKKAESMVWRSMVWMLTVMLSVTSIGYGAMKIQAADTNDYGFYTLSSAAASYYDASHKENPELDYMDAGINMGNAAGMLGYIDKNSASVKTGVLRSDTSQNSQTISLPSNLATAKNSVLDADVRGYMVYGYALNQMGYDATGSPNALNKMLTGLVWIFYWLSTMVDGFISVISNVLQFLNPFALMSGENTVDMSTGNTNVTMDVNGTREETVDEYVFSKDKDRELSAVADAIDKKLENADGTKNENLFDRPFLKEVRSMVSHAYYWFKNLSWLIAMPFFAIIMFLGILVFQNQEWSRVKKFVIRVVFLVLGVPILATLYTGILSQLSDEYKVGGDKTNTAYAIGTTYVDFENWVENSQLNLPAGASIKVTKDDKGEYEVKYEGGSMTNLAWYANGYGNFPGFKTGGSGSGPDAGTTPVTDIQSDSAELKKAVVSNLLTRYLNDTSFTSANFESYYKGTLGEGANEKIYDLIEDYDDAYSFADGKTEEEETPNPDNPSETPSEPEPVALADDPEQGVFVGSQADKNSPEYAIFGNGGLQVTTNTTKNGGGSADGTIEYTISSAPGSQYGLSTLGTYNYLNTKFSVNGITVYSPANSATGRTALSHRSVNVVGQNGMVQTLNIVRCLLMLACFSLLGFLIFGKVLIHNIILGGKTLFSLPGALFGSFKSIGKVISYVVMMIMEILASFAVYEIICQFLMNLNLTEFMWPTASVGSVHLAAFNLDFLKDAGGGVGMLIISIAVYAFILYATIRFSSKVIDGINEFVSGVVDKVIGVSASEQGSYVLRQATQGAAQSQTLATVNQTAGSFISSAMGARSASKNNDDKEGSKDSSGKSSSDTALEAKSTPEGSSPGEKTGEKSGAAETTNSVDRASSHLDASKQAASSVPSSGKAIGGAAASSASNGAQNTLSKEGMAQANVKTGASSLNAGTSGQNASSSNAKAEGANARTGNAQANSEATKSEGKNSEQASSQQSLNAQNRAEAGQASLNANAQNKNSQGASNSYGQMSADKTGNNSTQMPNAAQAGHSANANAQSAGSEAKNHNFGQNAPGANQQQPNSSLRANAQMANAAYGGKPGQGGKAVSGQPGSSKSEQAAAQAGKPGEAARPNSAARNGYGRNSQNNNNIPYGNSPTVNASAGNAGQPGRSGTAIGASAGGRPGAPGYANASGGAAGMAGSGGAASRNGMAQPGMPGAAGNASNIRGSGGFSNQSSSSSSNHSGNAIGSSGLGSSAYGKSGANGSGSMAGQPGRSASSIASQGGAQAAGRPGITSGSRATSAPSASSVRFGTGAGSIGSSSNPSGAGRPGISSSGMNSSSSRMGGAGTTAHAGRTMHNIGSAIGAAAGSAAGSKIASRAGQAGSAGKAGPAASGANGAGSYGAGAGTAAARQPGTASSAGFAGAGRSIHQSSGMGNSASSLRGGSAGAGHSSMTNSGQGLRTGASGVGAVAGHAGNAGMPSSRSAQNMRQRPKSGEQKPAAANGSQTGSRSVSEGESVQNPNADASRNIEPAATGNSTDWMKGGK